MKQIKKKLNDSENDRSVSRWIGGRTTEEQAVVQKWHVVTSPVTPRRVRRAWWTCSRGARRPLTESRIRLRAFTPSTTGGGDRGREPGPRSQHIVGAQRTLLK